MKKINIDMFDQVIYAFDSNKSVEKYCERNGYILSDNIRDVASSSDGYVAVLSSEPNDDDISHSIIIMVVTSNSLPLIVHECVHAAIFLLDLVGISVSPEEQEPVAYLTEYIFKSYCKKFKLLDESHL